MGYESQPGTGMDELEALFGGHRRHQMTNDVTIRLSREYAESLMTVLKRLREGDPPTKVCKGDKYDVFLAQTSLNIYVALVEADGATVEDNLPQQVSMPRDK